MLEEMRQKVRKFLLSYFGSFNANESEEGCIEEPGESKKLIVKPLVLKRSTDVESIFNGLREGKIIAIMDIKFIKENDLDYLKKVIEKLKKTCRAIRGDVASIDSNFIVATPPHVEIYRSIKNER